LRPAGADPRVGRLGVLRDGLGDALLRRRGLLPRLHRRPGDRLAQSELRHLPFPVPRRAEGRLLDHPRRQAQRSAAPLPMKSRIFIAARILSLVCFPFEALCEVEDFGPARFSFLRTGETRQDAARKLLGEPFLEYDTHVVESLPDPFVSMDDVEHYRWQLEQADRRRQALLDVHVLEYRDAVDAVIYAKLVFRKGVLWYALVPITPSEATLSSLE